MFGSYRNDIYPFKKILLKLFLSNLARFLWTKCKNSFGLYLSYTPFLFTNKEKETDRPRETERDTERERERERKSEREKSVIPKLRS